MKKYSFILTLLFLAGNLSAQNIEPEHIRSFAIDLHKAVWYENQADAWKQRTIANPQDEEAWGNYFKATRYFELFSSDYHFPRAHAVVEEMKAAIPDTYTYYISMYILTRFVNQGDSAKYGKLAIEKLPEKVNDDDINTLLGYLWMSGAADDSISADHPKWIQLLNQQYKNHTYPERVLRYNHNQFLGMERNGLYFAGGDMLLFPAKLLQDALGVHKDKQVIVIGYLQLDTYRNALFTKLGIAPFQPSRKYDFNLTEDYYAYFAEMVEYIIHATGRDAYFFPSIGSNPDIVSLLSKKLYNEGLLLHYSESKYDNLSVAKRNVEKRYHLEYLTEPNFGAEEWWSGTEFMQMNYVVLLSHLVKEYMNEDNKERAQWLSYILRMSVCNTPVDDGKKKTYLEILENAEK